MTESEKKDAARALLRFAPTFSFHEKLNFNAAQFLKSEDFIGFVSGFKNGPLGHMAFNDTVLQKTADKTAIQKTLAEVRDAGLDLCIGLIAALIGSIPESLSDEEAGFIVEGLHDVLAHMGKFIYEPGICGYAETVVNSDNTALAAGSGELDVFSTPSLAALVEEACWKSVRPHLEKGYGTVGTHIQVTHGAPTPIGLKVFCRSELTEVSGKKLVFHAEIFDETGKIGVARHERFIVKLADFRNRTYRKLHHEV